MLVVVLHYHPTLRGTATCLAVEFGLRMWVVHADSSLLRAVDVHVPMSLSNMQMYACMEVCEVSCRLYTAAIPVLLLRVHTLWACGSAGSGWGMLFSGVRMASVHTGGM